MAKNERPGETAIENILGNKSGAGIERVGDRVGLVLG